MTVTWQGCESSDSQLDRYQERKIEAEKTTRECSKLASSDPMEQDALAFLLGGAKSQILLAANNGWYDAVRS